MNLKMEEVEMKIEENYNDMRIDAVVPMLNKEISRSQAQILIKEGKILVDGKKVKTSEKVKTGQEIQIPVNIERENNDALVAEDIPIDIIYEDDDIIVVNKPKNMVVHPAVGNKNGTLVNALLGKTKLSSINGEFRPGIVHRLDKDTTGVLVIAKNNNAHRNIAAQIQNRTTKKIYVALVKGIIKEDNGVINMPIGRHPVDRKKMAVVKDGREAHTNFKVLKRFKEGYTLIEVELKTGRTHQIRVHMSHIGYPIVGDTLYSNGKNPFGVTSQMLHAKTLGFMHPTKNEYMEFSAEPPKEFNEVIESLEEIN